MTQVPALPFEQHERPRSLTLIHAPTPKTRGVLAEEKREMTPAPHPLARAILAAVAG